MNDPSSQDGRAWAPRCTKEAPVEQPAGRAFCACQPLLTRVNAAALRVTAESKTAHDSLAPLKVHEGVDT
jgi:hypothetical protein